MVTNYFFQVTDPFSDFLYGYFNARNVSPSSQNALLALLLKLAPKGFNGRFFKVKTGTLAESIGRARETVCRGLGKLEELGLIVKERLQDGLFVRLSFVSTDLEKPEVQALLDSPDKTFVDVLSPEITELETEPNPPDKATETAQGITQQDAEDLKSAVGSVDSESQQSALKIDNSSICKHCNCQTQGVETAKNPVDSSVSEQHIFSEAEAEQREARLKSWEMPRDSKLTSKVRKKIRRYAANSSRSIKRHLVDEKSGTVYTAEELRVAIEIRVCERLQNPKPVKNLRSYISKLRQTFVDNPAEIGEVLIALDEEQEELLEKQAHLAQRQQQEQEQRESKDRARDRLETLKSERPEKYQSLSEQAFNKLPAGLQRQGLGINFVRREHEKLMMEMILNEDFSF